MIFPKIPLAQSIIEICAAKGIKHIVISPGSRNAPLTIGFVNNPKFNCYSIADERCAAFFALGIAQQLKQPTAVICTSGSALLNFYPAVAEAFYSQIPLVVISADRPHDKIDIGDGQTIRQENVFANHSLYNANLLEDASAENDSKITKAIHISIHKKGPVHINAPFEEPLYETVSMLSVSVTVPEFDIPKPLFSIEKNQDLVDIWNQSKRKMILVGGNEPGVLSTEMVEKIANDSSVVVFTETTSNLHHPTFITNIDTIITPFTEQDFEEFRPDLLVTFGGMIVSKRIKAFLRKYKPKQHWHLDTLRAYDTFAAQVQWIETTPQDFFSQILIRNENTESDYSEKMQSLKKLRKCKHDEYLGKIPFSDFKVFEKVIPRLPKHSQLQISNSSAIRYAQLIETDPTIEVYCNRGTSGIDGSTTTAIGAAFASQKPNIFITGDVSFFYDSNALWNNYIPQDFKIILINNAGGGIFRILPGHQETPVFNDFFETMHELDASHLASMYNFSYFKAADESSLDCGLTDLFSAQKPAILEVFTPTFENDKILLQYFKELV